MNFLLGLVGICLSVFMIRYREMIGNMIGDADWMARVGGVYYVVVYAALILFLWSLAVMFGVTNSALEPIIKPLMPWLFT